MTQKLELVMPKSRVIIPHPGIMGGDDLLESVHAWGNPVVKIDIVRMK